MAYFGPRIDFVLDAHANYKRRCSCCCGTGRVHDRPSACRWDYVPLWKIAVYLFYAPRRVICPVSGKPTVEAMPWNLGKKTVEMFNETWDTVFSSVEWVVAWGLEHSDLSGVTALGVD